jgi:hypothetical protein
LHASGIVCHINGGQDGEYTAVDECNVRTGALAALEVAKYVLVRLVEIQSIERLAEEFDDDTRFIDGVVKFLIDMNWVEQDRKSGLYQMTENGSRKVGSSALKLIVWI